MSVFYLPVDDRCSYPLSGDEEFTLEIDDNGDPFLLSSIRPSAIFTLLSFSDTLASQLMSFCAIDELSGLPWPLDEELGEEDCCRLDIEEQ